MGSLANEKSMDSVILVPDAYEDGSPLKITGTWRDARLVCVVCEPVPLRAGLALKPSIEARVIASMREGALSGFASA